MKVGELFATLSLDQKNFKRDLKRAETESTRTAGKINGIFKQALSVTLGMTMFEGLKRGFKAVVSTGIDFNAMLQTAQIGFSTMLGSAEKAEVFLERLAAFAAKTPFEYPELLDAAKRMLAYGFAAEEVLPVLNAVGNAAAALGAGGAGIDRITMALGQIRAKGKLAGEEMRQLTEAGVPAWHILAEAMGTTVAAAQDMVSKGLIPGQKAVEIITAGMTQRFGGMMASMENTWQGVTSSIKDIWRLTVGTLTQTLVGGLTKMLIGFRDFLQQVYLVVKILFGKKAPQAVGAMTESLNEQAGAAGGLSEAISDTGDAARKAAQAARRGLAPFDELHRLTKGMSDTAEEGIGIDQVGFGGISLGDVDLGLDVDDAAYNKALKIAEKVRLVFSKISVGDVFSGLGEGLRALWDKGIVPIARFAAQDYFMPILDSVNTNLVPVFAEIIPWAFREAGKAFEWMGATTMQVWDTAIRPVYELMRDVVISVLEIISNLWDQYGQNILNKLSEALENVKSIFNRLWTDVLEPIIVPFLDMLRGLWENHLKGVLGKVGEFIFKLIEGAVTIYNEFIAPLGHFLIGVLGPIVQRAFAYILDVVGTAVKAVSGILNGVFTVLSGIIDFLVGVFTGDWERAWSGIKEIVNGIWEAIISTIKGAINLVITGINAFIRGLNSIKFSLPNWKILGDWAGKEFGINIPLIPKLAKGGIIDGPTLAMLGEAGKEAVMPLERNTGWIDELASRLASIIGDQGTGNNPLVVQVYVGEDKLLDKLVEVGRRRNARAGRQVVSLGVL